MLLLVVSLGNPFKGHEEVFFYLQPMIPLKCFDIIYLFPPDWGMLRKSRLDAFRFFLKQQRTAYHIITGYG